MKLKSKLFQYSVSVFTNEPKLKEREYYFDSVDQAWNWIIKSGMKHNSDEYGCLENNGYCGFELTEFEFNNFLKRN